MEPKNKAEHKASKGEERITPKNKHIDTKTDPRNCIVDNVVSTNSSVYLVVTAIRVELFTDKEASKDPLRNLLTAKREIKLPIFAETMPVSHVQYERKRAENVIAVAKHPTNVFGLTLMAISG